MRAGRSTRHLVALGIGACLLLASPRCLLAQDSELLCGKGKIVSTKFFRGFKDQGWKELGAEDISRAELGHGESFWTVETTNSGETQIRESVYGEDCGKHQTYCYSGAGILEIYRLQVNTAWGWGFERLSSRKGSKLVQVSSRFFNIDTNELIRRPTMADDLGYWMKPEIYSSLPRNPILPAFKKATNAQTH